MSILDYKKKFIDKGVGVSTNYAKVYEFKLLKKDKYDEFGLLKAIIKSYRDKKTVDTINGTFYIKDYANKSNSIVFLFGKDNYDASNYKRKKIDNQIEKIDINEQTEVLTDFVHFSISKVERLGTYAVLLEKNNLISNYNLIDFLNSFFTTAFSYTLSRRVTKDFHNEIENSRRIIGLRQLTKQTKPPLMNSKSKEIDDIEVSKNIEIKAKRMKTISVDYFKKFFSKFGNDPQSKIVADIINSKGNRVTLDFDLDESPYSVKVNLKDNLRTEVVQTDIEFEMNRYIGLDNEGKLWLTC